MSNKLRVAVIGCGGMGNVHLSTYVQMPDQVEIVAVCDIIPEKAQAYAEKFGVSRVVLDYNELVNDPTIDAINITTPNYLHSIIAEAALLAGKHVFCEKPDAISVAEAARMKEAAEKSGKTLMVMRNNRYYHGSQYLKQFINEGNMGEIYAARCGWQRRRGIPGKGGWFTTKEQSGGGPLIDLGVHMIDLALWLMGNPRPVAVSGCAYTKFAEDTTEADSEHAKFGEAKEDGTFDVEDLAMGFIRFDNGACLQIEFSWASNIKEEQRFVELRGTKSGATWRNEKVEIYGEASGVLFNHEPILSGINGHGANIRHFVDVVTKGTQPDFVPLQGYHMIQILEAIYKSAELGHEIQL
ncbi:MAG TPA: Gfo/Idh/MocA family oxidoreductase [Clostridiales bacterium]|nr:Gfo/Idh/MocA family oxidoreductase [Clostridiales bacterium]